MKYEKIRAIVKKIVQKVTFPKQDLISVSEVTAATRSVLGTDFADEYIASSDMEYVDGYWYPRSYHIGCLIETAILEVAAEKGYMRGYTDDGCHPTRDFSDILLSARAAKRPYTKWPKGRFVSVPNGIEREKLIQTIVEMIGEVHVPVDVNEFEASVRLAALRTGYLYAWHILRGQEVLISPHTQRVFVLSQIMCAAQWRVLEATGLKRVPTTDPRCTYVLE